MTRQELLDRLKKGPLILDGATGSNLMKAGMPRGICTEKWVAEHPDVLIQLQQAYVDAGSDILYAPTFMANRVSLREHGLDGETESLNRTLVSLSKRASGGRALVAGDLTTTGKMMEPLGPMSYDALYEAYQKHDGKNNCSSSDKGGVNCKFSTANMSSYDKLMMNYSMGTCTTTEPYNSK